MPQLAIGCSYFSYFHLRGAVRCPARFFESTIADGGCPVPVNKMQNL